MSELIIPLVGISIAKWAFLMKMFKKVPDNAELAGTVSGLWLYPIKSCGAISVPEADCLHAAMKHPDSHILDRHFMLIKNENFMCQRRWPSMALIKPEIKGKLMTLTAPGMNALQVNMDTFNNSKNVIECKVLGEDSSGVYCGKEASDWLKEYFGFPAHLVYSASGILKRDMRDNELPSWFWRSEHDDAIAYPDVSPYLLIGDASMNDLNTRFDTPLEVSRFRTNIYISDTTSAYIEDKWKYMYIGDAKFSFYQKSQRCKLPCVDQNTGIPHPDMQPLKTLRNYRIDEEVGASPCFGVHLMIEIAGKVKVGDPVYVVY